MYRCVRYDVTFTFRCKDYQRCSDRESYGELPPLASNAAQCHCGCSFLNLFSLCTRSATLR